MAINQSLLIKIVTQKNRLFIITGEIRSGKTLLISNVISKLKNLNIKVKGVYSPARFIGDIKTGIYLKDITSQKKKLLAVYQPGWDKDMPNREWKMSPETLQWGNEILNNSIPTSILIIDELGFLEFEKNQGLTSAFEIINSGLFKIALIVIRKRLLDHALAKWENAQIIEVAEQKNVPEYSDYLISQALATIEK